MKVNENIVRTYDLVGIPEATMRALDRTLHAAHAWHDADLQDFLNLVSGTIDPRHPEDAPSHYMHVGEPGDPWHIPPHYDHDEPPF